MNFKEMIKHPRKLVYQLGVRCGFPLLNDEQYIKLMYWSQFGKLPDLENPKTFNEKIQWLKLHDRKDIYTTMVDKCEGKKYVENIVGSEYIIPTLGVWDSFDEIDFDLLPTQFVLKTTHDSGGVVIVKDKSKLDLKNIKDKLNKSMKRNYYYIGREYAYKNIKPRLIAEQYLTEETYEVVDNWKFYCVDGEVKLYYVSIGGGHTDACRISYFDLDNKMIPVRSNQFPNFKPEELSIPKGFDKMKELASILSKGMKFLRVDFYYVNNHIYVGELTLYPYSGFEPYIPASYDLEWGKFIKL